MGEHSLKSLAALARKLSGIGSRLGPARGTLLVEALRRGLQGEALPRQRLLELFEPLDADALDADALAADAVNTDALAAHALDADAHAADVAGADALAAPLAAPKDVPLPSHKAADHLEALLQTLRALLPRILSAALRGDARLLSLPAEELRDLLPLWSEAARVAKPAQDLAFASLFSLLASLEPLAGSPQLAPLLRRIFLRSGGEAGQVALAGLLVTGQLRTEDRRVLRRLDLHLMVGSLPTETLARLGAWALEQPQWRPETLSEVSRQGRRGRLRTARLLGAATLGSGELSEEHANAVGRCLRHLLGDPCEQVAHLAARAAANMMLHDEVDDFWEPWLVGPHIPKGHPRAAAGAGLLFTRMPGRAEDLVPAVISGETVPTSPHGAEAWLIGLTHALEDLTRYAPEHVEPLLRRLEETSSPEALAGAAQALAMLRIRDGVPGVNEDWLRRLDRALGDPHGRLAHQWACVLGAREALVVARGGHPTTGLRLQVLLLAADYLGGAPSGRVISSLLDLLDQARARVKSLSQPPSTQNQVVLGAHLHELDDLMACLVYEDLLGTLLIALGTHLRPLVGKLEELLALKVTLRLELHRLASDPGAPAAWRRAALSRAAACADSVPDDPLARPSPARSRALVQLVALPELVRGWQTQAHQDASMGLGRVPDASVGLGRVLDATLASATPASTTLGSTTLASTTPRHATSSSTTPGSGDSLLAVLLAAPDAPALAGLAGALAEPSARPHMDNLALLAGTGTALVDLTAPPETRVSSLLVATEALVAYPLRHGAFAAPRAREALETVARHLRTAASMDRPLSFMAPVRHSLEQPSEPLLVALARDLAGLRRLSAEAGETARRVALHALGEEQGPLGRLGAQTMSRIALESSSWEAEAVVTAEAVGDAVRRGAATVAEDRGARTEALSEAAEGLDSLASLTRSALPGLVGGRFSELFTCWAVLLRERRAALRSDHVHPLIIDRFHIERLLGEGGMAYTYLARDPALERKVTLKVMKPEVARKHDLSRLFSAEGKALAALPPHPNVVQVFEHLEADAGLCLVMELVDGESLADLIPPKGLPLRRALDLAVAAAGGLHHVHRHQLVHLDVKPENIMVRSDGAPKLIDFGLAQRENAARESRMVLGTPVYMSPEQARGLTLGAASDVYSFGVLLYEIFSGEVPFDDADPREVLKAQVTKAAPPLSSRRPDLPDGLVLLVHDMLQKAPENRPWMVEVASRLARLRSGLEPGEEAPSTLERRDIAVMCASLQGLALTEREPGAEPLTRASAPDPRAVASSLELFLGAAYEIVSGLGGRIDATLGERVFAVFGYPRGDAQAALHAVQAATQLRLRFERLDLPGIAVFAGVATGEALVGLVRGDPTDATVLGEPLWRAARLTEEASLDAPILADEAAVLLLRGLVDSGDQRTGRMVGRHAPVTLRVG